MDLGRQRVRRRYACLLPLVLLFAQPALAQADQPAPLLPAGPHPVGFRHAWAFDDGRTYRTAFDEGATYGAEQSPRPLLVLQWYPAKDRAAEAEQMAHGEYFSIASTDLRLSRFAEALRAFARDVFVRQVMGRAEGELSEAEPAHSSTSSRPPRRAGAMPSRTGRFRWCSTTAALALPSRTTRRYASASRATAS